MAILKKFFEPGLIFFPKKFTKVKDIYERVVFLGMVLEKGTTSLPYAGQQITEYFGRLLTESGYRYNE